MLSIGQFSKVCQVSVKTLHHYDKIGLLHPSAVDSWTGYRYYTEAQIPAMLLIQRLKRYGFALFEISVFLQDPDAPGNAGRLRAREAALNADIAERGRILRELEKHIQDMERTGSIMSYQNVYQVDVERTGDIPVISSRQVMSVEDFGKYYGQLYERVAREGIKTNGVVMAVYHDEEFNRECSDIELALGLNGPGDADRLIPGGMAATTIHHGAYASLHDAYGAIARWMAENGYEGSGAPYEIYLKTQFDKLPPEAWETKIFFPVRKK